MKSSKTVVKPGCPPPSVPHDTVGAPSFAAHESVPRTRLIAGRKGWVYKPSTLTLVPPTP